LPIGLAIWLKVEESNDSRSLKPHRHLSTQCAGFGAQFARGWTVLRVPRTCPPAVNAGCGATHGQVRPENENNHETGAIASSVIATRLSHFGQFDIHTPRKGEPAPSITVAGTFTDAS
jgi:hypothetical protein